MSSIILVEDYINQIHNFNLLTEENIGLHKEELRKFFPSIWNKIKGSFQMFLPIVSTTLPNEQRMINKYIKGLNVEVRLNHDPVRNAWTSPGIESKEVLTVLNFLPFLGDIIWNVNAFSYIKKTKIMEKVTAKNGIVTFPSNDLKVLAWQTKGLITDLDDEKLRLAIMIHEIGHWARIAPVAVMGVFYITYSILNSVKKNPALQVSLAPILSPLLFLTFIAMNLSNRKAEKQADLFVKKVGYGKELAAALDRVALRPRSDISWINKIDDWVNKIFFELQNVLDKFVPFLFSYPSINKRKEYLTTEQQIFITEGVISKLSEKTLKPICNKVDKVVAPNLHKIFPIK